MTDDIPHDGAEQLEKESEGENAPDTEQPGGKFAESEEAPVSTDQEPLASVEGHVSMNVSAQQKYAPLKGWADLADALTACKTEAEREQLLSQLSDLADYIWKIVEEKRSNGNKVPKRRLMVA